MGSILSIALGYHSILNNNNFIEIENQVNPPYYIFEEKLVVKITRCKFINSNYYQYIPLGSYHLEKQDIVKLIIDDPTNIKLQLGKNIIDFSDNSIKDKYKIFIPVHSKYKKIIMTLLKSSY